MTIENYYMPLIKGLILITLFLLTTTGAYATDFANIAEHKSGNFNIGAGVSDNDGEMLSLQLNKADFLGIGNRISTVYNKSEANTRYLLRYTDPHYNIDGMLRTFIASYSSTDYEELDIAHIEINEINLSAYFSIPISESNTLGLGLRWENVHYKSDENKRDDLRECLGRDNEHYISYEFRNYALNAGLTHDTRDNALFPKEGARISGNLEVYGPGSGFKYYKADYSQHHFFPLNKAKTFVLAPRLLVAYVDRYGGTPEVPCADRFFAGGTKTIRGYLNNSLGPRNSFDDPEGGTFKTIGNLDLYFPTAFLYDPKKLRASVFTDIGNVYEDFSDFDASEMRGSVGINVSWITAISAVTFNFATQYNDKSDDETETFQFDLEINF